MRIPRIFILLILVIFIVQACAEEKTLCGLDVVIQNEFKDFTGKKVGLICNHTSVDKKGNHIVDLFHGNVEVKAIFAPEHGFRGEEAAGGHIADGVDTKTGIAIFSLYGKTKKPTPEMLKDIDVLVYDIQDVGVRFYTYISTMTYCMESASENNIKFIVLDRPNPIRGNVSEGGILEDGFNSFVGMHGVPIRYGMTAGEYAKYINGEGILGSKVDLSVVKVKGWQRNQWYDETDLNWIKPSPNMPDLETAIVYPGMCFLEGTNLNEGRGTHTPFLLFGAPWLDNQKLCDELKNVDGIEFTCQDYTPIDIKGKAYNPKYEGEICKGVMQKITDRNRYKPIETTAIILQKIAGIHPQKFQWKEHWIDKLSGNSDLRKHIDNKEVNELFSVWAISNKKFMNKAKPYFIY